MYSPGILPVVSNEFGKAILSEILSCTSSMVEWSWKGEIPGALWSGKGPRG